MKDSIVQKLNYIVLYSEQSHQHSKQYRPQVYTQNSYK